MSTTLPDVTGIQRDDPMFRDLLDAPTGPCISIYLPTETDGDKANVNRIRFKSLVQRAAQSLGVEADFGPRHDAPKPDNRYEDDTERADDTPSRMTAEGKEQHPLIQQLVELEADFEFWNHQRQGLGVFVAEGVMQKIPLSEAPPELAVVADSFHIKPLLRQTRGSVKFRLLALTEARIALYDVDRRGIEPVDLHPDVPRSISEALGGSNHVEKTKRSRYEPEDSDGRDNQLKRYFHRVDKAIQEHHRDPGNPPLMLAALSEYHGLFRAASHVDKLLDVGIKRDPFHGIDHEDLHRMALEAYEPIRQQTLEDVRETFGEAISHNQGSEQVDEIAKAAAFGRVMMLLLKENHQVGGTLDPGTGEVTYKTLDDPHTDDVLDDIAEAVLKTGGRVAVLTEEEMPTDTGVAAVMRYQV